MSASEMSVTSKSLFADVSEWRKSTRHFFQAGERAAEQARRTKSRRVRARMWRAYELNFLRCPEPMKTIRKCGYNGCILPNGHPENMAHQFDTSANTNLSRGEPAAGET